MNYSFDGGRKPASRPLPGDMPEFIAVELKKSEYRGQSQWTARYRLYQNDLESDYMALVVNVSRHFWPEPEEGEKWWVKPRTMAPQKRLVFAEACGRVREHRVPLTTRTREELLLTFEWSKKDRHHRTFYDNWLVILRDARGICPEEPWRVRVESIDPLSGLIGVNSVGPHPKMLYEPPMQVGLMSVIPIFEGRETLEGDVLSYWRGWQGSHGGHLSAEIEHKGRIIRLDCSELRLVRSRGKGHKPIEKIVGLVSQNDGWRYLAELVLLEGETVQRPELPNHQPQHRRAGHPIEAVEENNDDMWDLLAEIRANEDRPDYG